MLSKNDFRNLLHTWKMKPPSYKKITLTALINGDTTPFPIINKRLI